MGNKRGEEREAGEGGGMAEEWEKGETLGREGGGGNGI